MKLLWNHQMKDNIEYEKRWKFVHSEEVRVVVNAKSSYVDSVVLIEWCLQEQDWKYYLDRSKTWYYAEELQKDPSSNPSWNDDTNVWVPDCLVKKR